MFRGGDGDGESSEEDEVAVQVRLSSTPWVHSPRVCFEARPLCITSLSVLRQRRRDAREF